MNTIRRQYKKRVFYQFAEMRVGKVHTLEFDNVDLAKAARAAAHNLSSVREWKFETRLSIKEDGSARLRVERIK